MLLGLRSTMWHISFSHSREWELQWHKFIVPLHYFTREYSWRAVDIKSKLSEEFQQPPCADRTLCLCSWVTSNKLGQGYPRMLCLRLWRPVIFLEGLMGKRLGNWNAALWLERDCNPALPYPARLAINRPFPQAFLGCDWGSLENSCTRSIWWTPVYCSGVCVAKRCMDIEKSCAVNWSNQSCHISMYANWGDQFSYGVQSLCMYFIRYRFGSINTTLFPLDFTILIVPFIILKPCFCLSRPHHAKMQFGILSSIFLVICPTQVLAAPARNSTQNHDDSPSYCLPGCWPESPDVCPLVSLDCFIVHIYDLYLVVLVYWWMSVFQKLRPDERVPSPLWFFVNEFFIEIILTFIVWRAVLLRGLVMRRIMCCVGLDVLSLSWGDNNGMKTVCIE